MRSSICAALALVLTLHAAWAVAAPPAAQNTPQLLVRSGALPSVGRIVIRSGLSWLDEESPAFAAMAHALGQGLSAHGLMVLQTPPSRLAPLPEGARELDAAPVPEVRAGRGRRQRPMALADAVARMQAMNLAREGKLPQVKFQTGSAILAGVPVAGDKTASPMQRNSGGGMLLAVPRTTLLALSPQETIRFALSQEKGTPSLRGQVSIPGRLPEELQLADPAIADYAVVASFAMLWPAAGGGDQNLGPAQAAGWHLLELACYDLAPARTEKAPLRIWKATVQRVARDADLSATLPDMAKAAVGK